MPAFYTSCTVPTEVISQSNGCFNDITPLRLSDVKDGLTSTIFASEKVISLLPDVEDVAIVGPEKSGKWVSGDLGDTLFTTLYPPNAPRRVSKFGVRAHAYAAASLHGGRLNLLMGDGSVRTIDENIDSWPFDPFTGQPAGANLAGGGWWQNLPAEGVWQALSTRGGGEPIDDYF
jgi:prepilin-type processing-associated H-X9-DG protein